MNKEELTQSVKQKRQSTALLALYIKQVIFLLQKKPRMEIKRISIQMFTDSEYSFQAHKGDRRTQDASHGDQGES